MKRFKLSFLLCIAFCVSCERPLSPDVIGNTSQMVGITRSVDNALSLSRAAIDSIGLMHNKGLQIVFDSMFNMNVDTLYRCLTTDSLFTLRMAAYAVETMTGQPAAKIMPPALLDVPAEAIDSVLIMCLDSILREVEAAPSISGYIFSDCVNSYYYKGKLSYALGVGILAASHQYWTDENNFWKWKNRAAMVVEKLAVDSENENEGDKNDDDSANDQATGTGGGNNHDTTESMCKIKCSDAFGGVIGVIVVWSNPEILPAAVEIIAELSIWFSTSAATSELLDRWDILDQMRYASYFR